MSKVIIGIHGRANKPEQAILREWWEQSIKEGLSKNLGEELGTGLDFEMVYYADTYYDSPLSVEEIESPYRPANDGALKTYKAGVLDLLRSGVGDWLDNPLDWLEEHSLFFSKAGQGIMQKTLKDLAEYYGNDSQRDRVKARLQSIIAKRKNDQIFLISHSMGSIVAYDVLRDLGRDDDSKDIKVEHFVTLGSPLGLTPVKGKILDFHNGKLRTPSCVTTSWFNFSDPRDVVCLDSHLSDDYAQNSSMVRVKDIMVNNDYPNDSHNSFGYLRTPEFSEHLMQFI